MGNLGVTELLVIGLVVILLFGASRFSEIGKGLGQGIKNFKQGLKEANEIDTTAGGKSSSEKDSKSPKDGGA